MMKKRIAPIKTLIFSFIVFNLLFAKGIGYHIIQFNSNNGLSQNTIYSIVEDSKGYMWFGTFDGLNRFDGYNFKKFHARYKSKNSLTSNDITFLHVDKKNRFWISVFGGGLNQYFPESEKFISYKNVKDEKNSLQSDFIYSIQEDENSDLWFATLDAGIIKFEPEKNKFTKFLPEKSVPVLSNHIRSLTVEKNKIWFGSTKGIGTLNRKTGEIKIINDKDNFLPGLFILSICKVDDNNIWL